MTKRVGDKTRAIVMGDSEGELSDNVWGIQFQFVGLISKHRRDLGGWTVTHSQNSQSRGCHFKIQSHCNHTSGLKSAVSLMPLYQEREINARPFSRMGPMGSGNGLGVVPKGFLESISIKGSKCKKGDS